MFMDQRFYKRLKSMSQCDILVDDKFYNGVMLNHSDDGFLICVNDDIFICRDKDIIIYTKTQYDEQDVLLTYFATVRHVEKYDNSTRFGCLIRRVEDRYCIGH